MNEQFTPELLTQARAAETPEALLALGQEHGITLTPEEAQTRFDQFHQTGALSDEELDNVAGGCGKKASLPKFKLGDIVRPGEGTGYFYEAFSCPACWEGIGGGPKKVLSSAARIMKIYADRPHAGEYTYELACQSHNYTMGEATEQQLQKA